MNTFAGFDIGGKDMRYDKLQKRLQRNHYAKKENDIYLKKYELFKQNLSDLKKQSVIAFSLAGAAIACQFLFRGVAKVPYKDIEKVKKLAREITEKYNLQNKGFSAVIADKNQSVMRDIYGKQLNMPETKNSRCGFYTLPKNIALAWKNSPLDLFHEIGHGVSGNKKFGKNWLFWAHRLPYYSPVPLLCGLINTSDKDKKSPLMQKACAIGQKLKDTSHFISMALFLPLLAEEFNASRLALMFLKSKDKKIALKSTLLYLPAFGSYLVNALAVANFVKVINKKSDNIYLQKSLYKQANDYEKTLKFDENVSPKIAVIDEYKNKAVKIDWDDKPDMLHGEAVESFIKKGLPDATISRFDTNLDEVSVKNALDEILKSDVKYDAINLSKSSDIKISDLSALIGLDINAGTLKENKKLIKERFYNSPYQEAKDIKDIIKKLELLASKGVRVYISAGNKGKDYLNLYTLADNVNVVGAANKYGVAKSAFSCDNSLVTRWCKGVFKVIKVKTPYGKVGFDINEDGKSDILVSDTSSMLKIPKRYIFGTSFAAPNALVYDFKKVVED